MISQEFELVAGDFCMAVPQQRQPQYPTPPGRTPLWGPGSILGMWADVCGFLKPLGSQRFWNVNKHGAFSIPRKKLGLRPNDQSCHETWLHLHFVDWSNTWSKQDVYEQRISLKERPADCSCGNPKKTYSRSHDRPLALVLNV